MRKPTLITLLVVLMLTACNMPISPTAAPNQDTVATQVSQLLTQAASSTPQIMTATPQAGAAETSAPTTAPSETPAPATPTNTAAPTAAQPSTTPVSGDPKNSLGTPAWQDTTDTSKSFYLYKNEGTEMASDSGMLVMKGLQNNGWLGWSMTHSHPAQNFYLEATFRTQDCSGADEYGLVFRAPDDQSGYFFSLTCDGKFSLDTRNFNDNSSASLIKLTPNSAIIPGGNQVNRLGVMANGDKIGLYANGTLLQEVNDKTFNPEKGYLGVQIAANKTAGFTVRMEEIALWKLP